MADAADGAAFHATIEFLLAPGEQIDQHRLVQAVTHAVVRQACALRELVPWADELAIVAAVDTIADQRPQLDRNAALQFNRQIGNATTYNKPKQTKEHQQRTDNKTDTALPA